MTMKVILAWYNVKDLERAKAFYGTTLGLTKTFEMDGWAEFAHAEGAPSIGLNAMSDGAPGAGRATVVLEVADIDNVRARLALAGVEFVGDTMAVPGVVRIATFRDPFGNQLQLAQTLLNAS
jgi:predicted enzyme related to lactoylglutathione lyase